MCTHTTLTTTSPRTQSEAWMIRCQEPSAILNSRKFLLAQEKAPARNTLTTTSPHTLMPPLKPPQPLTPLRFQILSTLHLKTPISPPTHTFPFPSMFPNLFLRRHTCCPEFLFSSHKRQNFATRIDISLSSQPWRVSTPSLAGFLVVVVVVVFVETR
ncbi:hypothetical protein BDU57DRAFT_175783 [Ampelomyces quisqualis]|uniref:Uncharacterized protein n=1 Tax=Ampelomyces quisqualis TaxID=50730 RepID=A0A6A5QQR6_AMPQU|nr:hypothetical protein BDU57DRAFT_175783 [Ampelomyces quisqualis]